MEASITVTCFSICSQNFQVSVETNCKCLAGTPWSFYFYGNLQSQISFFFFGHKSQLHISGKQQALRVKINYKIPSTKIGSLIRWQWQKMVSCGHISWLSM